MNKLRATVLLAALVLFALAAGGVAWWWLGEDGDDLRLRESHESGGVAEDGEPGAQSGGRGRPPTRRSSEAARPRPSRQVPAEGADGHGQPASGQRLDEQELASIERVRLELPIQFMIEGVVQPDVIEMQDGQTMKGLRGPLDGGPWRFRLRHSPSADHTPEANNPDPDAWPHFASPIVQNRGVSGPNGMDPRPGVTVDVQREVMPREQWEMLLGWTRGANGGDATTAPSQVWTLERDERQTAADRLVLGVARTLIRQQSARITFTAHPIELTAAPLTKIWAVKLRFVAPGSGEPTVVPGGEISASSGIPHGWHLNGRFSCDRNGCVLGVLAQSAQSDRPVDFLSSDSKFHASVERAAPPVGSKYSGWYPDYVKLGTPSVNGRVLDFGDVVWPHRILRVELSQEARTLLSTARAKLSDPGFPRLSEVVLSLSPSRFPPDIVRSNQVTFPLLGLNSHTDPDAVRVTASVAGSGSLSFKPMSTQWEGSSGLRTVVLEPTWLRTVGVHVRSQGQLIDRAVVIPLPANTDELKRHAAAGTLPEFVAAVAKGYGTFDESITTALPYPHVIPADPQGIPGHWIAAAVNGKGAAITWVPITQTEDVVLELGQVGTGVLTRITATMPALAGDAVPGAAAARSMGWRGRLTYLLKARAEGEEHVRDLGKITFGDDGAASAMANLDPSVAWTFFLHQFPEAGVYLPLHDNVEVAALGPFRVQAGETPGVTPAVDLGSVAPPKMIVRHRLMDGLAPLQFTGSIEGTPIDAKPAFAWANGHGCDTSKFVPPCVWDGRAATPLVWQPAVANRDDAKADARPFLDLPANASVVVVSSTHSEFHLRVEGPWWFWGWRWEYTMPLARGQKQRIWLPFGACKLTVTAATASGSPPGSTGTTPPSKSMSVTVAEGWAGDHQVVVE